MMIPKEGPHSVCLSVILIDFVSNRGKSYYLQGISEECKCILKEKKISKYISDDIKFL